MAVNRERKMVQTNMHDLDLEYVTLADARKEIDRMITAFGENALIKKYESDYSTSEYLGIFVDHLETDKQMAKRIAQEERMEDLERYRYVQLKAKFGD